MKTIDIQYRFTLPDGQTRIFDLKFDRKDLSLLYDIPRKLPAWTTLEFKQCPHCPLSVKTHPHCPLAVSIRNVVEQCNAIVSHQEVTVEVTTNERVISQKTSAQRAISSLMGLIIATSGCPHTGFFKPMARFHLPFASEEETIYRSASSYLLAQFFMKKKGLKSDTNLKGLEQIYKNVHTVNLSMSDRLRECGDEDSYLNALVLLDCLATLMPATIKHSLKEIEYVFKPFWKDRIHR